MPSAPGEYRAAARAVSHRWGGGGGRAIHTRATLRERRHSATTERCSVYRIRTAVEESSQSSLPT